MSNLTAPPKPYPLEWPVTWPRTADGERRSSKYRVDRTRARDALIAAVRRLSAHGSAWLSSNVPVLGNGLPRADYTEPKDPGVAVYWENTDRVRAVMACDHWRTVRENMRAVTLAIEAYRALERSGAGQVVDRAFGGLALPEQAGASSAPWWETLGVSANATPTQIRIAYRELARTLHPDKGGSPEAWIRLNHAYAEAMGPAELWSERR